jgi:hypothetical protein
MKLSRKYGNALHFANFLFVAGYLAGFHEKHLVIAYLGAIHGASKLKFFADINVFLFPSLYRNETQGIVNLEALAADLPVVAYGQCCIPSDLNDPSCAVLNPNLNFETAALDFVGDLAPRYREACEGARASFRTLTAAHTGKWTIWSPCWRMRLACHPHNRPDNGTIEIGGNNIVSRHRRNHLSGQIREGEGQMMQARWQV